MTEDEIVSAAHDFRHRRGPGKVSVTDTIKEALRLYRSNHPANNWTEGPPPESAKDGKTIVAIELKGNAFPIHSVAWLGSVEIGSWRDQEYGGFIEDDIIRHKIIRVHDSLVIGTEEDFK